MEQEIYQALPSQHIRVVFVEPGNWDDELRCSLHIVPLEGKGTVYYEALSYCWGENELTSTLITPCGKLPITKTCDEAIRRLRWRTHTRVLWIDQISINQSNNHEKADQIRLMTDIYQRAGRVIIYLGEPGPDTWIKTATYTLANRDYYKKPIEYDCFNALSGYDIGIGSDIIWEVIFSRPWFERAWVLQEVDLAKSAAIVCGSKWVSWAQVRALAATEGVRPQGSALMTSISTYGPGSPRRTTSLLYHLHRTRDRKATDPRDKIFSLMGILNPAERLAFADIVSYDHSTEEIYFQTAKRLIDISRSLEVFSACGEFRGASKASWIPNWEPLRQTSLQLDALGAHPYMYDAGGSPAYTNFEESCMIARGIQVDTVQENVDFKNVCAINKLSERVERNCVGRSFGMKSTCRVHGRLHSGTTYSGYSFNPLLDTIIQGTASDVVEADILPEELMCNFIFWTLQISRNIMATTRGFIGLIPEHAQTGDVICVLLGGPTPYVLRPVGDGDYILVGECYVYGLMNGQALVHLRHELDDLGHVSEMHCHAPCTGSPLRTFRIV